MFASMVKAGWSVLALQQAWAPIPLGSAPGALIAASAIRRLALLL
jgi:hypothetical protein